jgi:hypothetical protein
METKETIRGANLMTRRTAIHKIVFERNRRRR